MAARVAARPAQYPTPHTELLSLFSRWIPPLSSTAYKGQQGKVGVVGGCVEFTGAPFFAASSAHKVGADLTYIIAMPEAAPIIKSFSPDMMVMPYLPPTDDEQALSFARYEAKVRSMVGRMSALVLGCGLGDDPGTVKAATQIIRMAREQNLPLLIDGSGLNIIASNPGLVKGYRSCILTPNVSELGRLAKAVGVQLQGPMSTQWQEVGPQVAAAFGGLVLVAKGPADLVTDGQTTLECAEPAGLKRSGGQGDVLAGIIGTFLGWSRSANPAAGGQQQQQQQQKGGGEELPPGVAALPCSSDLNATVFLVSAYAGCTLMRRASSAAYQQQGRGMLAPDVISQVPAAARATFPGAY